MNRYFLIFGLVILLSFSVRCNKNKDPNDSKDELTILYIGDERIFHQDYWGMEASFLIFSPLASYAGPYNQEIHPILAESWTHSEDYKTWTVKLREDIYWHDGVQMTSEDIKFTIDLRNEVPASRMIINCEVIDDFSFRFIFDKPISEIPTWEVYYPKHLLKNLDPSKYYSWDFWLQPIGNGPYKFVRNMPKAMVEVKSNPKFVGGEPKIKKVILKFSQTPALQELLSGNVDAISFAPRDFLFKIKDDKRYKSYYWWGSRFEFLFWNHDNPLFRDAKVRRALTMAINRKELTTVLNYPENVPFTDVLYTKQQLSNNDIPAPMAFDPIKAKKLLSECGWVDSNADNILDREGVNFEFKLSISERNSLMATYIQDNFKRIGIKVDIASFEENMVYQQLLKSDFEALIDWRFPSRRSSISRMRDFFNRDSYINYQNEQLGSIINRISETGDKDEIDRLYKDLATIFEREVPITFLTPKVETHIVKSNVKGLKNLTKADPVWFLESLWIE